MKASYKIVYNRKRKLNKEGKALVQLQVCLQRKQRFFSTGIYLIPKQWDASKRQVKNHPNQIRLNKQLRDLISGLEDFELKVAEEKKNFGFAHVENYLSGDVAMEFIELPTNLSIYKLHKILRHIQYFMSSQKTIHIGLLRTTITG